MNKQRLDWWATIILFIGLSSLYFATTSGITSSNDGSHYALTRTMVENGRFTLTPFDPYAEGNDIAIHNEQFYSDRPPGTALASTLFYAAGRALPLPHTQLPSKHNPENPALLYVMLLPVWAGTATLLLLYWFMRQQALPLAAAFTACLMVGLATPHWKYSTVLFSHALSGFLTTLSLFLSLTFANKKPRWFSYMALGFVTGFSVLVEYSNALLVLIVALIIWAQAIPSYNRQTQLKQILLPFVLGGLLPATFLAFYNNSNFGSPFTLSYAYAINYPWASSFRTTFTFPLREGLQALLFWGEGEGWCNGPCWNQGIFLLSPVLLLTFWGLRPFYRHARSQFALIIAIFLTFLLLFAQHRTFHGFTADSRYLAPYLPLLSIPLAFALSSIFSSNEKRPLLHTLSTLFIYTLFFLSIRNNALHIGTSFNYTLDLSQLSAPIAHPANWRLLTDHIFPNSSNLPYLWAIEASLFILTVPIYWLWRRTSSPPAPANGQP